MRRRIMESDSDVIDLSMVDNAGRARTSRTTANCYLVHKAGRYKFPLVFGNAIKNGETNTNAFRPGGTTTDYYLADFEVYGTYGKVRSGWMMRPTDGEQGQGYELGGVSLVWQDRQGLITDVSYEGDYMYFTVGTFGEGNAVLAIHGLSDQIMWSWHIWATNETLENTSRVSTGDHDYDVAPVNLGFVKTGGTTAYPIGYNTYYQFGRKDPFLPWNGANVTAYDINNNTITAISQQTVNSSVSTYTISRNLQYPTRIFNIAGSSGSGSQAYTCYYYSNLWNSTNSAGGNISTPTTKTIYDPCPPDFVVPTSNLFYFIASDSSHIIGNFTYYGCRYTNVTGNELWFPANGYRNRSDTSVTGYHTRGDYGSATEGGSGSNTNYRYLHFNSSEVTCTTFYRAVTTNIRPVREE